MSEQRLGILGGMGPQATQDFYQRILDRTDASCDQEHLPTLIWSDTSMPDRTAAILGGDAEGCYRRLLDGARLLERGGCTALAIPCNTSHYFADRLQGDIAIPLIHMPRETVAVLAADGQYTADALTGPLNGIYSAVSLEWDAMADSAEGGLFRRARLTDLLAAYGADACQDLVLIPFKTNLEDSDLTTEEYNLTGLLDYPILANAGCFALQDTGDAAALKSAESAVLWLYSSGDGEKALTNTLGVITPWNTASDTTTLGAMQVEQVNTAILPGIDLPTAAAAQALTANEEALQGGTRGKAERTAFTQAALAALGAE